MNTFHKPVLLQEVLEFLSPHKGGKYIDATLGGGGHTLEILKRDGRVLGVDTDQDAIGYVQNKIKDLASRRSGQSSKIKTEYLILVRGNFRDIDTIARSNGFDKVDGILFDLGVSSYQLETAVRGFSFLKEGPLDMRMDKQLGVTAADLLHALSKGELYELFYKLGEERNALAISETIIRSRGVKKIETTKELADIIRKSYKGKFSKIDPATRVFQALRIAVNDELHTLSEALPKAVSLLKSEGKMVVISFHSLEDRIVKQTFKVFEEKKIGTVLTKKPVTVGFEEVKVNPRSRSAKLRVFEKL